MKRWCTAFGIATLALYAIAGATGREFGASERAEIPTEMRHEAGGYRSFHFWHVGSRWGK